MALLMPKILNLSDGERHQLQKLIDKHKTPQQLVLRAKIILMASDGQNHREIARSLEINRQMARFGETDGWKAREKTYRFCKDCKIKSVLAHQ